MIPERQAKAVDALSQRDGGFAVLSDVVLVQTVKGRYIVKPSGDVEQFWPGWGEIPFPRLMREVYGEPPVDPRADAIKVEIQVALGA